MKFCYKVSLHKNCQRQSCSTINYLLNGMNILAADDPIPVKFGPKGTDPQWQGSVFHVSHMQSTVQSAIADLLVTYLSYVTFWHTV